MLSVHSIRRQSGNKLASYYTTPAGWNDSYLQVGDDLYEPPGTWQGSAVIELRLNDTVVVTAAELLLALHGAHPRTAKALSATQGDVHKPGWDLCFSAPKTVSAAWAVADIEVHDEIELAQRNAVTCSLAYLERNAIFVRIRKGRNTILNEHVSKHGGALFATFMHSSSRAGDPQLHSHNLLMNITRSGRSLDFSTTYIHAAGAIYRTELSHHLHKLGFEIERDNMSFKLLGAPNNLVKQWSQRRSQIVAEAAKHDVRSAAGFEAAALATRTPKTAEPRAALFLRWANEASEHGYGPKVVREQIKPGANHSSRVSPEEGLIDAVTQARDTFSAEQALVELAARARGRWSADELEIRLQNVLQTQAQVFRAPDIRAKRGPFGMLYVAPTFFIKKHQLITKCEQLAADCNSFRLDDNSRHAALDQTNLSLEQRSAFAWIVDTGRIAAVQSSAGAEQFALLRAINAAFTSAGYRVLGTAQSHQGVNNLATHSGIYSRNVEQLLSDFEADKEHLDANTLLVVDGTDTLGTHHLGQLILRVEKSGAKIILAGNSKRLQAIQAGGTFQGIHEKIGCAELLQGPGQQEFATREIAITFRKGGVADGLKFLYQLGRLVLHQNREAAIQAAALAYVHDLEAGKNSFLVAKGREFVGELQVVIREMLKSNGSLGTAEITVLTRQGYRHFALRDRVVMQGAEQQFSQQLESQHCNHAYNRTTGTIESIADDRLVIRLDSGGRVEFDTSGARNMGGRPKGWPVDYGYTATMHKVQDMTVDCIHLIMVSQDQRKWAYAALAHLRATVFLHTFREALGIDGGHIKHTIAAHQLHRTASKEVGCDHQIKPQKPSLGLKVV